MCGGGNRLFLIVFASCLRRSARRGWAAGGGCAASLPFPVGLPRSSRRSPRLRAPLTAVSHGTGGLDEVSVPCGGRGTGRGFVKPKGSFPVVGCARGGGRGRRGGVRRGHAPAEGPALHLECGGGLRPFRG